MRMVLRENMVMETTPTLLVLLQLMVTQRQATSLTDVKVL